MQKTSWSCGRERIRKEERAATFIKELGYYLTTLKSQNSPTLLES